MKQECLAISQVERQLNNHHTNTADQHRQPADGSKMKMAYQEGCSYDQRFST
jgi:hypothetical protein